MAENFIKYANSFQTVISLRLERISALLDIMGNPQNELKFIHVAGTNGKGSVCAFLEKMLINSGVKVGKYTSPNLIRVNERIVVDGEEIPDSELEPLLERIGGLCGEAEKRTGETPSQFEVWTAAAMEYFRQKKCEIVILEVGLGGEFDATNVIPTCEAAVICRIALDHCAYLGSTPAEIAAAKCGIFKEGKPVIALSQGEEVNSVIEQKAKEKGCPLVFVNPPESVGHEGIKEKFVYKGIEIVSGLGGLHQIENASVAAETGLMLNIPENGIKSGILSAKHMGRIEELEKNIIFDGAHNPNGIEALINSLDRYFPNEEQTVIFACMKDKEISQSLKMLASSKRRFIFTQVNNPRSMKAEELRDFAGKIGIQGEAAPCLKAAVARAKKMNNRIIICGSLYLYEDVPAALE